MSKQRWGAMKAPGGTPRRMNALPPGRKTCRSTTHLFDIRFSSNNRVTPWVEGVAARDPRCGRLLPRRLVPPGGQGLLLAWPLGLVLAVVPVGTLMSRLRRNNRPSIPSFLGDSREYTRPAGRRKQRIDCLAVIRLRLMRTAVY